jgi:hypothetical protein
MLNRPYFRLYRPSNSLGNNRYLLDPRYASDRNTLTHAYSILQRDFIEILDFIQPADLNKKAYSHRTYELLLRACAELETNFKSILEANGYKTKKYNIRNYFKLNRHFRLSDYELRLDIWTPKPLIIKPYSLS